MFNKRGQGGLSMNTIIIAIIGIIVLLLIVTFFTGGMSTVFSKIQGVFSGGTAGYDLDLAQANCKAYCQRAQTTGTNPQPNSIYCQQTFDITDTQGNVQQDKHCSETPIGIPCTISGQPLRC
jgi:hypothetical protein